jgi:hypothetical protein
MNNDKFPIDAVITWVEGSDPKFLQKKKKYISELERKEANHPTRFNEIGELNFVVKSILKFAPFVRKIFIVTDDQIPSFLKNKEDWSKKYLDKIELIDHKEIFRNFNHYLPTFNILSIECLLYKIKDLSEHFIYFNDDTFLVKPTNVDDWFINGLPVIRGKWITFSHKIWYKKLHRAIFPYKRNKWSYKKAQEKSAKIIGFNNKYFRAFHNPKALVKSNFSDFFELNPKLLSEQVRYKFRSNSQFNPYVLSWHHAIKNNRAILTNNLQLIEVNFSVKDNPKKILRAIRKASKSKNILFLNLQSLDLVKTNKLSEIISELDSLIKL